MVALDPRMVRSTVIDYPDSTERRQPRTDSVILNIAQMSQSITPWGHNWWKRDRELRALWKSEPWLASVVYLVTIRNASFEWEIVGSDPTKNPPVRTIQAVTDILKSSNLGKGWENLVTKTCLDLYCLAGHTRITLGGERKGQTKTIAQIVKDKDSGPVISVDDSGHLVEKPITEWHKTPLGGRKWYWLSAKNSHHSGKKRGGIFLTEDHPMLTDRGWVQAKDITTSDKIATSDLVPSHDQMEVLIGGLLGDMSMSRLPKRALIRFNHSVDQIGYYHFKKNLLDEFGWTGESIRDTDYGKEAIGVNSLSSLGLVDLYDRWYTDGKVINRQDIEHYFSPKMLAIWFMDDGSKQTCITTADNECNHGVLCTDGFAPDETEWLVELLNNRGFECKSYKSNGYTRIRFSTPGFRKLSEYIGEYVIPSMRYKLDSVAPEYNPVAWDIDRASVFYDDVVVIQPRDYYSGKNVCQTTYHIGVEDTRNFVAAGLISHNTQDNGSFWQIIRQDNRNSRSPIRMIQHLDSNRCQRTGDPRAPIIYTDRYGREHLMRYWQVRTIEELPSPIEDAYNLQICAVSRALIAAEIIQSIEVYKKEKVDGNFTRAIDFVSGATKRDIDDALVTAKEENLNRGVYRYGLPIIIPGIDPTSTLSHVHIDLASLPDNFDEDTSLKWYVAQLAAAFGVDYQEIAPLMTGNLGSSQQSEIMHLKTRGKGPALIMRIFEDIINGLIPKNVKFRFKEQDVRAETEKAEARFTRGKDRAMRLKSGEINAEMARRLAVEDGDLKEWMADKLDAEAEEMEEEVVEDETQDNELNSAQMEGGIESGETKILTSEHIQAFRDYVMRNKISVGNPSAYVVLGVNASDSLLELQQNISTRFVSDTTRIIPRDQLHITLVYSSLVESDRLKLAADMLEKVSFPKYLTASTISKFDSENGTAIVLKIDDNKELKYLQDEYVRVFTQLGIPLSEYSKNWTAHLTLLYTSGKFEEETISPIILGTNTINFSRSDYETIRRIYPEPAS